MVYLKISYGKSDIEVRAIDGQNFSVVKRKTGDNPEFDRYVKRYAYEAEPCKIAAYIRSVNGEKILIPASALKFQIYADGCLLIDSDDM